MPVGKKSGASTRSGVFKNMSSSLFSLGLILGVLSPHGGFGSAVVKKNKARQTKSNIIFIDPPGDFSASDLQKKDGTAITLDREIKYELFFSVFDSA
ncbi:unnamed protein product, partial [Pylaiella littoralis]